MIKTVYVGDSKKFEEQVNKLLKEGYKVISSYCTYVPETRDTCGGDIWQAILIKE